MTEREKSVAVFVGATLLGCGIGFVCARILSAPWGLVTVVILNCMALANIARIIFQRR